MTVQLTGDADPFPDGAGVIPRARVVVTVVVRPVFGVDFLDFREAEIFGVFGFESFFNLFFFLFLEETPPQLEFLLKIFEVFILQGIRQAIVLFSEDSFILLEIGFGCGQCKILSVFFFRFFEVFVLGLLLFDLGEFDWSFDKKVLLVDADVRNFIE